MKVLWISPSGGNYNKKGVTGGGGWISSLQTSLMVNSDIDLAITFLHDKDEKTVQEGKTTYYPIKRNNVSNNISKLFDRYFVSQDRKEGKWLRRIVEITEEFKPDIIHIWGVENFYCKIVKMVKTPCIIHIQGFANPIINSYFPPDFSSEDLKKADGWLGLLLKNGHYYNYKQLLRRASIEKNTVSYVKYWMGRTDWDKTVVSLISPDSKYFHCDEIIRSDFYNNNEKETQPELTIHTTITERAYKGIDIILKTAKILNGQGVKFRWNVCGCDRKSTLLRMFSKKLRIDPDKYDIIFHGLVNSTTLHEIMASADIYVHPSYIDNSPNALVEAQLMGIPVVATHVGGIPTLVNYDYDTLVPANDPWAMASKIISKSRDKHDLKIIKEEIAKKHDPTKIANDVINIYKNIISESQSK